MTGFKSLSSEQQDGFVSLLCGFVILDKTFCDDEEAFISNLLAGDGIPVDQFYDRLEQLIGDPAPVVQLVVQSPCRD